jgi:hypothetical protein
MDGKKAIPGKKPINYIMQDKHAPDTTTFAVSRLKMGTGLMPESYSSLCKAHSQFRTTPAAAPIQIQKTTDQADWPRSLDKACAC